jgi:hypothetical protein
MIMSLLDQFRRPDHTGPRPAMNNDVETETPQAAPAAPASSVTEISGNTLPVLAEEQAA